MATIRPLSLKEYYFSPIEAEIQRLFDAMIYGKLVAILRAAGHTEVRNAITSLIEAVRDGTVWYEDGQFKGRFSARISKELLSIGAKFNKPSRTFSLAKEKVPADIRIAQADADVTIANIRAAMIETLDQSARNLDMIDKLSDTTTKYKRTVEEMQANMQRAAAAVTVFPPLTDAMRDIIAKEWGQNLNLYIKEWTGENIIKLREQVQVHALAGGRAQGLQKVLEDNYGTSKSKAKFLARQETALLMAKFQETRYGDIGITRYRWSTSHDERVRPDHKALNGKVFSFASPPCTDSKTGARNNPGEDFNCRCIAIPIIE